MRANLVLSALVGVTIGMAIGVGGFTFVYARGASYLANDPRACVNCHIMSAQYEAWTKSSHHAAAVCNDCHAPHDLLGKWKTKAVNGFFHSYAFTTGDFPEPIRITERNRRITEGACRHCHAEQAAAVDGAQKEPLACLACHAHVGHLSFGSVGELPHDRRGLFPAGAK